MKGPTSICPLGPCEPLPTPAPAPSCWKVTPRKRGKRKEGLGWLSPTAQANGEAVPTPQLLRGPNALPTTQTLSPCSLHHQGHAFSLHSFCYHKYHRLLKLFCLSLGTCCLVATVLLFLEQTLRLLNGMVSSGAPRTDSQLRAPSCPAAPRTKASEAESNSCYCPQPGC